MATLHLGQCVSAPVLFPRLPSINESCEFERKLSDSVDFRPAVSASDQRLATRRKLAAPRVKTKPIPSSRSACGSGTVAPPDPDVHREFVSMAPQLWYTVTVCGKINGDGVERMHLQEIVDRIDQRLEISRHRRP